MHLGFQTDFVPHCPQQACFSAFLSEEKREDTEMLLTILEHSWNVTDVAVRTAGVFLIENPMVKLGLLANGIWLWVDFEYIRLYFSKRQFHF